MPGLRVEHVRKTFGAVVALDDVTVDVEPGAIVALVGDDGAGKFTLVKCIAGVHRPTAGRILLDDRVVGFAGPLERAEQASRSSSRTLPSRTRGRCT